jgi:hypothetical protein
MACAARKMEVTSAAERSIVCPLVGALCLQCGASRPESATTSLPSRCHELAISYCSKTRRCHSDLFDDSGPGDGHATLRECEVDLERTCAADLAAPSTGATSETVSACTRGLEALACSHWRLFDDLPILACHPRGSLKTGARCARDAQCASSACVSTPISEGQCFRVIAANERCSDDRGVQVAACELGFFCSRGKCIGPFADEGERCSIGAWYDTCYRSWAAGGPQRLTCHPDPPSSGVCRRLRPPADDHGRR